MNRSIGTSAQKRAIAYGSGWPRHVRAYGGWLGMKEPMKDVATCEKLRGGGKQPVIRRCPNGETYIDEVDMLCAEYIGV